MIHRVIMTACALVLPLLLLRGAARAFPYQIDDGNAEFRLGPGPGTTGFAWINSFQVAAGGTTLTTIEIALAQEIDEPSRPVTVYLWTDPSDDGDPSDAVVARSVPTFTSHEIVFETFPIEPLTLPLASWLYAGAIYVDETDDPLFPAATDATEPFFPDRSFTITWGGGAVPDPNNLAAGSIFSETAGNYLIRVFAVPEPSSVLLLVLGGAACWWSKSGRSTPVRRSF